METILYGIPNCDTVRKARAWLTANDIAYRFHDFKKDGVSVELLAAWAAAASWEILVNRSGTTWRALAEERRAAIVDADSAIALMAESPSVIKRPVLVATGIVNVGFSADAYAQLFGARQSP
nr:ArsC family reductase [uncultured Noviherbaspirillum sp.]